MPHLNWNWAWQRVKVKEGPESLSSPHSGSQRHQKSWKEGKAYEPSPQIPWIAIRHSCYPVLPEREHSMESRAYFKPLDSPTGSASSSVGRDVAPGSQSCGKGRPIKERESGPKQALLCVLAFIRSVLNSSCNLVPRPAHVTSCCW